ncbi:hypothetical protein COOONC_16068 [Cooperia oncophora]
MGNAACRSLLDEAKNYQLLRFSSFEQPNIQEPRTRSRKPLNLFCDTFGKTHERTVLSVWNALIPKKRDPYGERVGLGNAFLDDFLYAIGGVDGETYLNSAER